MVQYQPHHTIHTAKTTTLRVVKCDNQKSSDNQKKIIYLTILAFLMAYVGFCASNDNYLLRESIACALIISCLMFFKATEQTSLTILKK